MRIILILTFICSLVPTASATIDEREAFRGNVECAYQVEAPQTFMTYQKAGIWTLQYSKDGRSWFLVRADGIYSCREKETCTKVSTPSDFKLAAKKLVRALRLEARKSGTWSCPMASTEVRSAFDPKGYVIPLY